MSEIPCLHLPKHHSMPSMRRRWMAPFCALLLCLAAGGCAHFKQVQYFEAVGEPNEEGVATRQFYRVTISGGGHLVQKYNMNAAYLSAAALETLQGSKPRIPIVDTPDANLRAFDEIKAMFLESLKACAEAQKDQAGRVATSDDQERHLVAIARQIWLASLSDADLCSMGQFKTADGHAFRRLVFWTSAQDIDLSKYSDKIDAAISNVEIMAEQFKAKRDAEAAQHKAKRQENLKTLKALVNTVPGLDPALKEGLIAILDHGTGASVTPDSSAAAEGNTQDTSQS